MIRVERTPTPPESLEIEKKKASENYRTKDVVNLLRKDFRGKCYLCEIKVINGVNIEHLIPHKGNLDLKFAWDNLFFSCSHCNSVKNQVKYDGKIIDCCKDDPEKVLYHIFEKGHVIVKPIDDDCNDETVKLTAELITKCFESVRPPIRTIECEEMLKSLEVTMLSLYNKLEEYSRDPQGTAINAIRGMLDLSYKFAGFTRTYVRLHLSDYPELAPYVA